MADSRDTPTGPTALERVLLCRRFERTHLGRRSEGTSRPGHLLQLTVEGACEHRISGRDHLVKRGTLVWFHEDEWVSTHVTQTPWVYYSVNFIAPGLLPPEYDQRVRQGRARLESHFKRLRTAWESDSGPRLRRDMQVHAELLGLLARILPDSAASPGGQTHIEHLWWDIESMFRRDLTAMHTLADLAHLSGRSAATISRSCRQVHGCSPMRRLKAIRLSMARGLVHHSTMRIAEIADYVGYRRQHELTRDYRRAFGLPPTIERQQADGESMH